MNTFFLLIHALCMTKAYSSQIITNHGLYYEIIGFRPIFIDQLEHYHLINTGLAQNEFQLLNTTNCKYSTTNKGQTSNLDFTAEDLCNLLNNVKTTSNLYRTEANLRIQTAKGFITNLQEIDITRNRTKRDKLDLANVAEKVYNFNDYLTTNGEINKVLDYINAVTETQGTQAANSKRL